MPTELGLFDIYERSWLGIGVSLSLSDTQLKAFELGAKHQRENTPPMTREQYEAMLEKGIAYFSSL